MAKVMVAEATKEPNKKDCPRCGAEYTVKAGFRVTTTGRKQLRHCQVCGHTFEEKKEG